MVFGKWENDFKMQLPTRDPTNLSAVRGVTQMVSLSYLISTLKCCGWHVHLLPNLDMEKPSRLEIDAVTYSLLLPQAGLWYEWAVPEENRESWNVTRAPACVSGDGHILLNRERLWAKDDGGAGLKLGGPPAPPFGRTPSSLISPAPSSSPTTWEDGRELKFQKAGWVCF